MRTKELLKKSGALEAMSCGILVLASNTSSIPEFIPDADLLFDSYDADEIGKVIYEIVCNEELKIKGGRKRLERAKLFSWEERGRKILEVYEEICSQKEKMVGA